MSRTNKDTPRHKKWRKCTSFSAYNGAEVSDSGKFLGYWDFPKCNRSRRNMQQIASHRRRAKLKEVEREIKNDL